MALRAYDRSDGVGLNDVSFSSGNGPSREWHGQACGGEVGMIEDVSDGLLACEKNVKESTSFTEKRHRITSRRVGAKYKSAISIKRVDTLKRAALGGTIAYRKVLGEHGEAEEGGVGGSGSVEGGSAEWDDWEQGVLNIQEGNVLPYRDARGAIPYGVTDGMVLVIDIE